MAEKRQSRLVQSNMASDGGSRRERPTWGNRRGGEEEGWDFKSLLHDSHSIRAVHQLSNVHRAPMSTWQGEDPAHIWFRFRGTHRHREWSRHGQTHPRTYTGFRAWQGLRIFGSSQFVRTGAVVGSRQDLVPSRMAGRRKRRGEDQNSKHE